MAVTTQTIKIDLSTNGVMPKAFTHQNDTARQFVFTVYNNGESVDLSDYTATFGFISPKVNGAYTVISGSSMASGTISDNTVTVTLTDDYTAISGVGLLTMILTSSSTTIRPINIALVIQKSADGDDVVAGASDFPDAVEEAVEAWLEANLDFGSDLNPVYDALDDGEVSQTVEISDGTLDNNSNANCVRTSLTRIVPGVGVTLTNNKPVSADGNYYKYGYWIYDNTQTKIYGQTIDAASNTSGFCDRTYLPDAAYIAFSIGEYDSEDTIVTTRYDDYDGYDVTVSYTLPQDAIDDTVRKRNVFTAFNSDEQASLIAYYYANDSGSRVSGTKTLCTYRIVPPAYDDEITVCATCGDYAVKIFRFTLSDLTDETSFTAWDSTGWASFASATLNDTYNAYAVVVRKPWGDDDDLTDSEITEITENLNIYTMSSSDDKPASYVVGRGIDTSGLEITHSARAVSGFIPVVAGGVYEMTALSGTSDPLVTSVSFYADNADDTERLNNTSWQTNNPTRFTVPSGASYIRFLIKRYDETTMSGADIKSVYVRCVCFALSDYFVDQAQHKTPVTPLKCGTLTRIQSFCKYGDYWYSTNGSAIAVQDSDFNAISETTISVGHGNSMQVGEAYPNYAYISGWNDQSVYVVDLDSVELVDTITLPTTGYTTCAVDDVNQWIYIFQRDTAPGSALENYNFIVYDYANETTISTRKVSPQFGAMQSCDYYQGKIYVLFGLGGESSYGIEIPNGYYIYNTNGDILGHWVMGTWEDEEPEGVYIDRDDESVYMSSVDGTLIKLISE